MHPERARMIAECIDRGGYRRGGRIAEFITEWEVAVRKTGGPLTTDEVAAWWRQSRPTAYRRLGEFRQAWPELGAHGFPHDLMRPLLDELAKT
jgi:hypothetical protein